jgi:lipopolysaccharide export LptBFGC system permease protein LptF
MKLWQKHLFSQLIKTYFFLLFCIFAIYVIVDLSINGIDFLSTSTLSSLSLYYLHTFSGLLELFLSLTFLLATMRVLFDLNSHREIVALQMAGLSKKRLLSPFFIFASFLSSLCYLNSQFLAPEAQDNTFAFKKEHKEKKKKKAEKTHVSSLSLSDNSEVVYLDFNEETKELFDLFWIKTPSDIWHMKTLRIDTLEGRFVNHLTRNDAKQFEKAESYESHFFPDLPWDNEVIVHKFIPFENRPLSTLLIQFLSDSAEKASVASHLYYKLLLPLMPFLVLFAVSPISMRYSRNLPLFLIASCAIFGFIGIKVVLDGMLILAENQVLPPSLALLAPCALLLALSLPNFAQMTDY